MVTKPDRVRLPMACCCAEESMTELTALVAGRSVSEMLHELHWEHDYCVASIAVDMWMGVTLVPYDDEKPDIYVEFDWLEHGLASALRHLTVVP